MVRFVWEYRVRRDKVPEFERSYSSVGPWVDLFRKSPGFRGTVLLQDTQDSCRFLTIDSWESVAAHSAMREYFAREYEELDRACEQLTETEKSVGAFDERVFGESQTGTA